MDITVGEAIKIGRTRKGWTQTKLAQMLDMDPSIISRWESNSASPTADRFIKLAELLEIVPLLFPSYYTDRVRETVDEYRREHSNQSLADEIARLWEEFHRLAKKIDQLEKR